MAKVVPMHKKVLSQERLRNYEVMFDMAERHLRYQKHFEDDLTALRAQGFVVELGELEPEFGEKTAVVSRIRVVKRNKRG